MAIQEEGSGAGDIRRKLDKLIDLIESGKSKKKEKEFKLPKLAKGKLKKNWVLLILIRTNRQVDIRRLPIEDEVIYLSDNQTYHIANSEYVMRYKNYPVLILHEGSLEPLTLSAITNTSAHKAIPGKVIIQLMKNAQLMNKKKGMNMTTMIIIIVVIAAGIFLMQSLTKKG